MSGFASGEGCFSVIFNKTKYSHILFKVTQYTRYKQLIESFIKYFKCGYYFIGEGRGDFKVTRFSDLN
jgi:hypothetical protein